MRRGIGALTGLLLVGAGALAGGCSSATPIDVSLSSYAISASTLRVSPGEYVFNARNTSSTDVHELALLRVQDDGSLKQVFEIEDIDPEKAGKATAKLTKGTYVLACFLVPGEAGSTVDHYKAGMRQELVVE